MFKLTSRTPLWAMLLIAVILAVSGCASAPKQESTGEFIDSATITTKVKAQLAADPQVKSLPITVKTYKGVVQLSGFVDSYQQKQRAVEIAKNAPGVKAVTDSLAVKPR